MQCAADAAANNAPSRFASGEACCFLLREGYIFSCFGAGIWFLCFGRIRCFPISGRAHSSCVEEGAFFLHREKRIASLHREGGILSTWEGRRGFRASVVVRFCFGEWRIVFDRVDARL